jgi:hypothetical protein
MSKLGMLGLACGVMLAATGAAKAQVQPAGGAGATIQDKPLNKDSFEALKKSYQQGESFARYGQGEKVVNHGDWVRVTPKGGEPITGVFVWSDPKTGKLYIRRKAGTAPVAVPARDGVIDRIRPAVDGDEKGGVIPPVLGYEKPASDPGYEIHTMTVRNGPYTTTYYYDSSLSPGEQDQLGAIEKAGSAVVQKGTLVESLRKSLEYAANDSGTTVVQNGGGYGYGAPVFAYPYFYPIGYYNLYYYLYYPWYGGYPYGYGWPGYYSGGSGSTVVVNNSGDGGAKIAALTKSLGEAQASLAEAQKNYLALWQRSAIYDPSGRIVAVRLEE